MMCRSKSLSFLQITSFVVLLLQHHHKTCEASNSNNQTYCPPSSCGKIKNIKHPFRLKNDPTTCGDPRYELSCEENNITTLTLFSGKYYVKSINYKNYTIRLVDPGIQQSNCSSIPKYYLSVNNFTSFYNNSNDDDSYEALQNRIIDTKGFLVEAGTIPMFQHVIYMNCSNHVRDDPLYVDTSSCIKSNSEGYVYAIAKDLMVKNLKDYCHVEVVASTSFFSFKFNYSSYDWDVGWDTSWGDNGLGRKFSYNEIHGMLLGGFEVSWIKVVCEEVCGDSFCYFSETTGAIDCHDWADHCITTLGFHVGCGAPSRLRMFIEGVTELLEEPGVILKKELGVSMRIYDASVGISESKIGIDIGRIIGKYILPSYIIIRFMLGLFVFFAKLIHTYKTRHTSIYENIEDFLQGNSLMPIRYSYKELKNMTRGFKDKLGEGGYGKVYKGKLRSGAIKMLGKPKGNGNGQDFISEVATIGRIHHTNVVRLIGFCVEGSKRALVYDFMPNGSLDRYISSIENCILLTYKQMFEISLGVARGIAYLHQGCDMQILHFDIKPHNILLDTNFIPKVSDFGLEKLYPVENSIVTLTAARGTIGYMAPELFYKNIGGVSYKADVYSFGMLLMEIANRKRNLNSNADNSSQIFFPFWIYNQLIEENEIEILGDATYEEKKNVKKMFIVALWCIQLNPNDRPSMDRVIEMLEGDIENIQIPPKPSPYPTEMIQDHGTSSSESISDNDITSSISFLKETIEDPLL